MADNPVWDEEEHVLRVMGEKCDTCIFGPNSVLLAEDTRNLARRSAEDQVAGNIVCHKTIKIFIGDGKGAICRGDWDRRVKRSLIGQLAVAEDLIVWWKPETDKIRPLAEVVGMEES